MRVASEPDHGGSDYTAEEGRPMTAPISRTLPVLALYLAALKLGIVPERRKKRPAKDARQMALGATPESSPRSTPPRTPHD